MKTNLFCNLFKYFKIEQEFEEKTYEKRDKKVIY